MPILVRRYLCIESVPHPYPTLLGPGLMSKIIMLNSMLTGTEFSTWLLTGWRLCCPAIGSEEIVGATQAGRQGLGSQEQVWWSRAQGKSRRELVARELRSFEDHKRLTKAVGQSKQGAWTRWEGVEQKKLTWSDLWSMEQHGISFLLRSVYDLLPTPANLTQWKLANSSSNKYWYQFGEVQCIPHRLCGRGPKKPCPG